MAHNGLVLVTGANGYVAARTVEAFVKAGYSVRGTVRSKSSAKGLLDALSEYASRIEIVEVPDITVEGAFDEAVKGESRAFGPFRHNLTGRYRRRRNCASGRPCLLELHGP